VIPSLADQFLASRGFRQKHADQQLPERPDHCSLVFGEVLPAAWIEGAETPDDLQSASVGSGE